MLYRIKLVLPESLFRLRGPVATDIKVVLPESLFRLRGPVATDSPLTARTTLTPRGFNF